MRMISITLLAALLLLISNRGIDAGQFGPPEPVANEGKISLGVGYFHFSGILNPHKRSSLVPQHDIEQNQLYLQAGYGFIKDWDAYLRVGASHLNLDNAFPFISASGLCCQLSDNFQDGFRHSGTFGVKGLLYDGQYLGIGPFFQTSLFSSYRDKKSAFNSDGLLARSGELKVKFPWDINLGVGLQTKVYGITLYGGPFAYWTGYKADKLEFRSRTAEGCLGGLFGCPDQVEIDKTHYREKNNFGGFVGLRSPLPWVEGVHAEVEGQFKNKASGGISLHYSF